MPTPPRTYHGAAAPGDPEGIDPETPPGPPEPAAWESMAQAMVGTVIDGRYRVDALLGAGAMAFVLDGHHVHLGRRVAIKVLHPELAELGELRARFQREARAASRVAHPAVIEVTDFGVSEEGLYYLVMEHLSGVDLHRWASKRSRLAPERVAHIGEQVAGALDAIHKAGFVHRDIKPENIFVLDGDELTPTIKVLDLGIAAVSAKQPQKDDPRLTRAGQTLGTVSFMAPEQVAARPLDGRVDIYATGCVLFELVTGHLPFEHESATETMMAHLREPPPPVASLRADVPGWLAAIIERCLAKRPDDRFQDAVALAEALRVGRNREPVFEPTRAPSGTGPALDLDEADTIASPRRKRSAARALVMGLLGAGAVAGVMALVANPFKPANPDLPAGRFDAPDANADPVLGASPAGSYGHDDRDTMPDPDGPADQASLVVSPGSLSDVGESMPTSDAAGPGPELGPAISDADVFEPDAEPDSIPDTTEDRGSNAATAKPARQKPVSQRDPPRVEPRAETTDTPKRPETSPSGLWRPRPPGGGD